MKVAVVMGSDSDFPILKPAVDLLHLLIYYISLM